MEARSDKARVRQVVETMSDLDLTSHPAWGNLDALSYQTTLDGIEVDPEAIIIDNDQFEGEMTVYVGLSYDDEGENLETSDAFAGSFKGHFAQAGQPIIDDIQVETAPFYR